MSAYFRLNQRGLDYLVSSPDSCSSREFLFCLLLHAGDKPASIDQLMSWTDKSQKQMVQMVYQLLKQGWLSTIDAVEEPAASAKHVALNEHLPGLSSSGQVVLADLQGLVIASSGFARDKIDYLAASASRLLSINEVARQRNMDLYNGQPWRITMHWGSIQAITQFINLGPLKFVLIIGGEPQMDKPCFLNLLGLLARRYVRG